MKKPTKLTESEIKSGNKLIAQFMELVQNNTFEFNYKGKSYNPKQLKYHSSWDWLMPVRYKIERMGAHLSIDGTSDLSWWYSPNKTGTFSKGAGGGGGWTEKRDPFDSIFGKFHERYVGAGETAEAFSRETEILATWDNIVYFIKWLNKTCPKLRNHIRKDNVEV